MFSPSLLLLLGGGGDHDNDENDDDGVRRELRVCEARGELVLVVVAAFLHVEPFLLSFMHSPSLTIRPPARLQVE